MKFHLILCSLLFISACAPAVVEEASTSPFLFAETVNFDSLQRFNPHNMIRMRFPWVLPGPYHSMWAGTASVLC